MYLDRAAAALSLQLCAVFASFTGLLCGPPPDSSFLSGGPGPRPHRAPVGGAPALGRKWLSALSFAGNQLSFVIYMLLVNVSAILIECIDIYSSLFASFTLTFFFFAF